MDDPHNIPPEGSPEELREQAPESAPGPSPALAAPQWTPSEPPALAAEDDSKRRQLRHNLLLLLSLTLAAFVLTAWILVRLQSPFGLFSMGPGDVVLAQLRALDRGDLRGAYGMFSERYRQEVPFRQWNELIVTHWRMFHAEVLRSGEPAQSGPRVTLEIHLRGADDKGYLARFTLIQSAGRWWVDDLHWSDEPDALDTIRT